ncbi:MAG: 30S ribosomal protein S3 [bacterium]
MLVGGEKCLEERVFKYMSHNVHPTIFRIGIVTKWKSRWFSDSKKYKGLLEQDVKLREFISKKLEKSGLDSIVIERSANRINIIISTSRPGLVIGRGGSGIEDLKKDIKKLLNKIDSDLSKTEIRLEVDEIRQPTARAAIVSSEIASQIERRMPYRRVVKQYLDKVMQNKEIKGVKIMVKGRLNGAEIARKEWLKKGNVPLQTLRADIDFSHATAYTTYGTIGVKVWIYKGEVF